MRYRTVETHSRIITRIEGADTMAEGTIRNVTEDLRNQLFTLKRDGKLRGIDRVIIEVQLLERVKNERR